jgi:hypothetical protein
MINKTEKIKIIKVSKVPGSKLKSNWRNAMQVIRIDGKDGYFIDKLPVHGGTSWVKFKNLTITNIFTRNSAGYYWLQSSGTPKVVSVATDNTVSKKKELMIISDIRESSKEELSDDVVNELADYIWIYSSKNFKKHWKVNEYISDKNIWDNFENIRSLNKHGEYDKVQGIEPKYFAIVCEVLSIDGDDGAPLESWRKY